MAEIAEKTEEKLESMIKEYSGMINKEKAREILKGRDAKTGFATYSKMSVNDLAKTTNAGMIDVEDYIYRIFNKQKSEKNNKESTRRTVVLGNESSNVSLLLWDKQADLVDSLLLERDDKVIVKNLIVNKGELRSTPNTFFARLVPSKTGIINFSKMKAGEKSIDIICRIVSLNPIRYFVDLSGRQSGVSDCSVTDGMKEAKLVMWRSSSAYSAQMHPGDYIKVEFATIKENASTHELEINANDSSRILVSSRLKSRIR